MRTMWPRMGSFGAFSSTTQYWENDDMRTQDEIVARIKAKEVEKKSLFGFDLDVLICNLDFERAKPWLTPEAKAEEWVVGDVKAKALDYLEFAWGKAEDHRGLSASRSVEKMTEYCWLLGHDALVKRIEAGEIGYAQYGTPILRAVSEALGYPVPTTPALVRMMSGASCEPGCENGCGQ